MSADLSTAIQRVIDGDTFEQPDGAKVRVAGVDAPETGKSMRGFQQHDEAGAQLASEQLDAAINNEKATLGLTGGSSYNRQVGTVTTEGGKDFGTDLIEKGIGRPTLFSGQDQLDAEVTAIVRRMGILPSAVSPEQRDIDQRMAQELRDKPYRPNLGAADGVRGSTRGTFAKAVARGTDTTQAMLYSAANAFGELTGVDAIAQWGEDGFQQQMIEAARNPAEIESFDDVKTLGDFGTYVIEALGEQVPNLALMATGAGAGAMAARATIGKALIGRMVGTTAASYPLAVGEVQSELKEGGIDSPGTAFVAGIPIAALDAVGFEATIGRFFGKASKEVSHSLVKEIGTRLLKGAGFGALAEVPTEVAQELIVISSRAYHDPSYEIFSAENKHRLREAGIKAGIVGGITGGGASGVHAALTYPGGSTPTPPAAEPATPPAAGAPATPDLQYPAQDIAQPVEPTQAGPGFESRRPAAQNTPEPASAGTVTNEPIADVNESTIPAREYTPDEIDLALKAVIEEADAAAAARPLATPMQVGAKVSANHNAPETSFDNPVTKDERALVGAAPRAQSYDPSRIDETDIDTTTADAMEAGLRVVETETPPATTEVQRIDGEARTGIAQRVASLFPGATVVDPKDATKNWSVQIDPRDWTEDAPAQRVLDQAMKVFSDGGRTQDKRANVTMPDGAPARANWMEVTKLGAVVAGRYGPGEHYLKQARDNLAEGMGYLFEKGVRFPELTAETVVMKAGKQDITYGQLTKLSTYIKPHLGHIRKLEAAIEAESNPDKQRAMRTRLGRMVEQLMKYGPSDSPNVDRSPGPRDRGAPGKEAAATDSGKRVSHSKALADEVVRKQDPQTYENPESEDDQARASSSLNQRGQNLPKEPVTVTAQTLGKKHKDLIADLLNHVGVDTSRVQVVDEGGAQSLLKQLKSEGKSTKHLEQMLKDKPRGRIAFNKGKALVFISARNSDDAKITVLLHELGHLVQFTALDTAPKHVQDALREASGTKTAYDFGEWFANQLGYWVAARKVPRGIVQKYFHDLVKKLKSMFDWMSKDAGLSTSYADFMDVMVGYRMSTLSKVRPKTDFGKRLKKEAGDVFVVPGKPNGDMKVADFGVREAVSRVITESRLKRMVEAKDLVIEYLTVPAPLIQTADGFMRGLRGDAGKSKYLGLKGQQSPTLTALANDHRHDVGTERKGDITIPQKIRNHTGAQSVKMSAVFKKLSAMSEAEQTALGDEMVTMQHTPSSKAPSPLAAEVRAYFDGMHKLLSGPLGMTLGFREGYFPLVLDMQQWSERRADAIAILTKQYKGDAVIAAEVFETMQHSGGHLMQSEDGMYSLAGPAFGARFKRKMQPDMIRALDEFFVRDVHAVMVGYTHAAIQRGVWEQKYGIKKADEVEPGKFVITKEYKYYSQLARHHKITDVDLDSPLAKFAMAVRLAEENREITHEEATRVLTKILPAYLGRLGADISPRWRQLSSWGVVYQNIRLLPMSVLSSFVDIGSAMYRSGKPLTTLTTALQAAFSKAKRKDLLNFAKDMGEIRDDVADHVLNDQMMQEFMTPRAAKINDWFFRKIGMQGWTNITRAIALSMGTKILSGKPTKAQLKELGLTQDLLDSWVAAGTPTSLAGAPQFARVIGALHQFVDESIIRPDAPIRPVWGSDARFVLLWHLKSFIYGFQKQILDRVIEQTKANPWPTKALPAIMLSAMLLPFAAAGYELRRFLTGADGHSRELQGWEYLGELFQRSGATGLMQFYIDAEEADNHGRMSLVALGGPTVEQFITLLTEDWDYLVTHGLPVFAQSPAARAWWRED